MQKIISIAFLFIAFCSNIFAQTDVTQALRQAYQSKSIERLNSFIAEHPQETKYIQEAIRIRDQIAFDSVQKENNIESYQWFIATFPQAQQAYQAKQWVEKHVYLSVLQSNDEQKLKEFIANTDDEDIAKRALEEIERINLEKALKENTLKSYDEFLTEFPKSNYNKLIKEKLEALQYQLTITTFDVENLISFLKKYPNHPLCAQTYDTLSTICIERISLDAMRFIYKNKPENINIKELLKRFSIEYINDGETKSFEKLFKEFPSLKADKELSEKYIIAKNIDKIMSLPNITDQVYRKNINLFSNIYSDKSIKLIEKYVFALMAQNKISQIKKVLLPLNKDYRVAQYLENIPLPKAPSHSNNNTFISQDSTVKIFSSKQNNCYGENDLFLCTKVNNQWSEPMLLPKPINSRYDEICPSLSKDKKALLFYSSNGLNFSDYDLYVSFRADTNWDNWSIPLKVNDIGSVNINDYYFGYTLNQDDDPISAVVYLEDLNSSQTITTTLSNPKTGFFALSKMSNTELIALKDNYISIFSKTSDNENILKLHSIEDMISKRKILTIESFFNPSQADKLSRIADKQIAYITQAVENLPYIITISVNTLKGYKKLSELELSSLQSSLIKEKMIALGMATNKVVAAGYGKDNPLIGWEGKDRIEIGFISEK